METYRRIVEKVRGAMWAHHRRLMPERQFHRILGYVYSNKYEFQIRFDKMTVVGRELDGKLEVLCTPAGHIKKIRANPQFDDYTPREKEKLLLSAYIDAKRQGKALMDEAEMKIYRQFLRDLKPLVMGIRDNPEFYTVPEDADELPGGVLQSNAPPPARTIPFEKAVQRGDEWQRREDLQKRWVTSEDGAKWMKTLRGKEFMRTMRPELPRGAPGAKRPVKPLEMIVPYTQMDEVDLRKRNWQAFLDNKHVAETMWTRARMADRLKALRLLQKTGRAWHSPMKEEAP